MPLLLYLLASLSFTVMLGFLIAERRGRKIKPAERLVVLSVLLSVLALSFWELYRY
ncbi:hypothetical protein ACFV4I_19685 [Nocardiopsis alba]|uniref:hypothetical protein n=1 Tax=Nocardiopsis alba TaxID=53437 RepID=UPI0033DA3A95